jgi:membrane-associated phospholipid phosphatase
MRDRTLPPLLVATGCAVLAAIVWVVAVLIEPGAWLDSVVLGGFTGLQGTPVEPVSGVIADLANPVPFAILGGALVLVALARRRPRDALVAAVVLAGANGTTQLLEPLLAAPHLHAAPPGAYIGEAAWPSGHATAAMTLALVLVLVVPSRLRPQAAAVGGAFAVAVGYALLVRGWHWPSDVLGGYCVAGGWLAIGVAVLRATGDRAETATLRLQVVLAPAAVAVLTAAAAVAAVAVVRPEGAFAYAQEHTLFVGAAPVIGAAGLALVAAAAAALRRAH